MDTPREQITLDYIPKNVPPVLHVSLGDGSERHISVKFVENGEEASGILGFSLRITFRKPDGSTGHHSITTFGQGNTKWFFLPDDIATVAGDVYCKIARQTASHAGDWVSFGAFIIRVEDF